MTDRHKIDTSESANSSHSKKRLRLLAGIASLLLLLGNSGKAQEPNRQWENLQTLRTGEKIQVVDQHLKSLKGNLTAVSETGIALKTDEGEVVTLPRAEVHRVTSLDRGNRRLRHALIGAAVGAAVGVAAGFAALSTFGSGDAPGGDAYPAVEGATWGGIGFGIGAAIPARGSTIYRGERRKGQDAP